jgi:hypothetical protein
MDAVETQSEQSGYPPIRAIQTLLQQPLDPKLIRYRPAEYRQAQGGKHKVEEPYVTWQTLAGLLSRLAPGWMNEITKVDYVGGQYIVTMRILIPCAEGVCYREGVGSVDEDKKGYGSPLQKAKTAAFKDACYKWGLAADLFDKDDSKALDEEDEIERQAQRSVSVEELKQESTSQLAAREVENQRRKLLGEVKQDIQRRGLDAKRVQARAKEKYGVEQFDDLKLEHLREIQTALAQSRAA